MKNSIFINHVCAAIIVTMLCLLIYGTVQQNYRRGANDPQLQLASEIKDRLERSQPIETIFPKDSIDLETDPGIFVALCDASARVVRSSASLQGKAPALPAGVFETAKAGGEDRVTWQPMRGVRMAMIVMKINEGAMQYVAVGRSLKEIEVRESDLQFMSFIAWVLCIAVIAINGIIHLIVKRSANG